MVFGHSHIPVDQAGDGQRIFNPGSPTNRRRQPHGTLGIPATAGGRLVAPAIVPVT
jgi:predicted phosphodiesterase